MLAGLILLLDSSKNILVVVTSELCNVHSEVSSCINGIIGYQLS